MIPPACSLYSWCGSSRRRKTTGDICLVYCSSHGWIAPLSVGTGTVLMFSINQPASAELSRGVSPHAHTGSGPTNMVVMEWRLEGS